MQPIDWVVILAYLGSMIGLSVYLSRGQSNNEDYYVGGRNLPWLAIGISTMATQTSSNSFVGIPSWVALKQGGGWNWLQYELAVPLAIALVALLLLPFFRKLELVSVYEYLEFRFDALTRRALSALFLLSRSLGTGAGLYGASIVLSVCLDLDMEQTIILLGVAILIYDTIGGIAAVVWSDVIQMVILIAGLGICVGYAVVEVGGWSELFTHFPTERTAIIDPHHGFGDGSSTAFWGFLFGGLVLYVSYYGVDQSQVQRALSTKNPDETRLSLVMNGFLRLPLTCLYLLLGMALWGAYTHNLELQELINQAIAERGDPNFFVPVYVMEQIPPGLRSVIFAAILAAAMSSLDSSINSISAVTMRDFIEQWVKLDDRKTLFLSKVVTVIWGVIITLMALWISQMDGRDTLVEIVNKIGSVFYGPLLAAFLLGVLSRRVTGPAVLIGVGAGLGLNVFLWLALEHQIFWMWWNVTGCALSVGAAYAVAPFCGRASEEQTAKYTLAGTGALQKERPWLPVYLSLVGYFIVVIVLFVVWTATR
ncbi:Sodium/glucose cotransporter [Planctomycetes bacterium Pan216]|uniref:Sodium/glucose cotransporter n=1 Tax=Kolteria novifilia TaxID=2527975 RepID=A0A518B9Q7_9BACT|nr:Sodium/glucose cotransporter [Planctomycetes bacterium Pan216]